MSNMFNGFLMTDELMINWKRSQEVFADTYLFYYTSFSTLFTTSSLKFGHSK